MLPTLTTSRTDSITNCPGNNQETQRRRNNTMVYKVRDLMVNVIRAGVGSVSLPADDSTPVPTPITPIAIDASLVALTPMVDTAMPVVKDVLAAAATNGADALARSAAGLADGSPAMNAITREVAATVVGAAVMQGRGGSTGMPDPNCGGTSMETIPTPLTPYVHKAKAVLRVEDLAVLKRRLIRVLAAVEVAEKALVPTGKEAADLVERLQGAAAELSKATAKIA
jgi:hypothetical protein